MAYQSRNSLSFSSVSQFNFSAFPSNSHIPALTPSLSPSLSFSPSLWKIAARHNYSTNTHWSVPSAQRKHLLMQFAAGGGWPNLSKASKTKDIKLFLQKMSACILLGTANEKVKGTFFRKPTWSIYSIVPVHMHWTLPMHKWSTTVNSYMLFLRHRHVFSSTKKKKGSAEPSARTGEQRPRHVFALFCPLITYTHSYFSQISFCVCVHVPFVWSCVCPVQGDAVCFGKN